MTTELLCRQSRVTAGKPRHMPLYDYCDLINQGHVFFCIHFELTPFSNGQLSKVSARPAIFNWEKYCYLLSWETHEAGHRLADGQLSSPCPPSPSFRSFGATSVMMCSFPPASSGTPLRPSVRYFLEEALLINLVKVS